MAPIGTVTTTFALDKTRYQGLDPVTGTVSVNFRPTSNISSPTGPDLFGLLKLRVILQGRILVNVAENRTSHACIFFNEKRILFSKHEELINGPFRASANDIQQFPFQIQFPVLMDSFKGHKDMLPPTIDTAFSAIAARQIGRHHGSALIEYHVRVEAEMPGIDVKMSNETPPRTVVYQPPSEIPNPARTEFSQILQLQSYSLLPEQDRPSLLEKTKAKMTSAPKPAYSFSVTCVGYPDAIPVGEEIKFDLRIRHESNGTTTKSIPDIALGDCKVDIVARTQLYATNKRGADSARIDGSEVESCLSLLRLNPAGAFKKEDDFAKTLVFEPIPKNIPCTFLIRKLGRSYRLRLDLQFLVAEQRVNLEKIVNIRILPPPSQRAEFIPEAGPSRVNGSSLASTQSDDLPSYDEIGHSAPPFQHV